MKYRGYLAAIKYSNSDDVFVGQIAGVKDGPRFSSETVDGLKEGFRRVVDAYIAEHSGEEMMYKGTFNIRISPELHRWLAVYASIEQVSLNTMVEKALLEYAEAHQSEDCPFERPVKDKEEI